MKTPTINAKVASLAKLLLTGAVGISPLRITLTPSIPSRVSIFSFEISQRASIISLESAAEGVVIEISINLVLSGLSTEIELLR
jgi:hypothetical protein